ncbi:MAG: fibronectin type III domain-containing protein [bacterium]
MFKYKLSISVIFSLVLALLIQGCTFKSDEVIVVDDTPPAAPRGVYSITGDGQVFIKWYPNQEKDLKGYIIYRSTKKYGDYIELGRVSGKVTSYIDTDVKNGFTYYYAVSAIDYDGNESELSPDIVEDTPRPEGTNIKLNDYILDPARSGFSFSNPERGAQRFDNKSTDIYFGVDIEVNVPYIYSDSDVKMQDLGYTDSMDDIDVSPTRGFTELFVEAIIGHTYAFLMPDGHYAKIRITDIYIDWVGNDVRDAWIVFDWAYQLQVNNPELAPERL